MTTIASLAPSKIDAHLKAAAAPDYAGALNAL